MSWWPLRLLERHGVHPLWATALVYLVSVLALLAVRPRAWRGAAAHPLLWLLAASSALTNVAFNWGVTVGDVVRVVLLFYLMPAWTVLLAWVMLGERPTRGSLARVALALVGVAIVLSPPGAALPVPQSLPDWLALAGGGSFALTNVLLRRLRSAPGEARVLAMFAGGAVLAVVVAAVATWQGRAVPLPDPATSWVAIALALSVFFLAANVALQYGAARLGANTGALIMLSEIVFASVSSVLLGASEPTWRIGLGGALVIGTAVWAALVAAPKRAEPAG